MAIADEVYAKLQDLEARVEVTQDRVRELERDNENLRCKLALAKEHTRDALRYLGAEYVGPV